MTFKVLCDLSLTSLFSRSSQACSWAACVRITWGPTLDLSSQNLMEFEEPQSAESTGQWDEMVMGKVAGSQVDSPLASPHPHPFGSSPLPSSTVI